MEEQTCENCRYYLQHYAKIDTYFTKVFCGHCTNPLAKARDKRKKYNIVCEHWEPIEIRERERKESIERTLRNNPPMIISPPFQNFFARVLRRGTKRRRKPPRRVRKRRLSRRNATGRACRERP